MDIVLVLIGIIIALFSGWYTYRSYRQGKEIASKGAKLKVGLFSSETLNNLYILLPFNKRKMFLIPFIVSLKNCGEISAKNVEVFITVSSGLFNSSVGKKISNIGIARGVKHAAEEGRTKHLTDSYLKVGDIPPKTTFNISDEFSWDRETIIREPFNATSKDGIDLTANITATFSLTMEVKIMYQDNEPIIKYYSIEFRKFGENDKLKDFIKREEELLKELQNGLNAIDFKEDAKHKNMRIVTFGSYEKIEEVMKPMKNNKNLKIKIIRCNVNSAKYIDCMISGNRLILAKQ